MGPKALGKAPRAGADQDKIDRADDKAIADIDKAKRRAGRGGDEDDDDEDDDQGEDDDKPPKPGTSGGETDDDGNTVIHFDDDEDDEDDDEGESRADRRRKRGQDRRRDSELEEIRSQNQQLRGAMAVLQRLLPGGGQQQKQNEGPDPLDEEWKQYKRDTESYRDRMEARMNDAKNPMTRDEVKKFDEELFELEERKADILYRKNHAKHSPKLSPEQEFQQDVARAMRSEFPDVLRDDTARSYADYQYKLALKNGADRQSIDVLRAALRKAREDVLGKRAPRPAPSESRKARYRGTGRGAGMADAGSGGKTFVMTPMHKASADQMYSYIKDPKKRYQKYARTHAGK